MMKLIGALFLVATVAVPQAGAVFRGALKAGTGFQSTVNNPTGQPEPGTVGEMILGLKKAKLIVLHSHTVAAASVFQVGVTPPKGVTRILFVVDIPTSGAALVKVNHAQSNIADEFSQLQDQGEYVYDVTP